MSTITLKGLTDPLHEALKKRARMHRRSLNSEILACLEAAVRPTRVDPAAFLAEAREFRAELDLYLTEDRMQELRAGEEP